MGNLCIKIEKKRAKALHDVLVSNDLIDRDRKPSREEKSVFFPVIQFNAQDFLDLKKFNYEIITHECPPNNNKKHGTLLELLTGQIPDDLLRFVPRSFNIIGNIIILEIPEILLPHSKQIASALHSIHPNIKTIYNKRSERTGEFRTRKMELLWGDDKPRTTHIENDVKLLVDVKSTFFDPRLSNEHSRVFSDILEKNANSGCKILDLFCGVGPFTILLAKKTRCNIWAIDLNPAAIDLLETNIKLNKITGDRIKFYKANAMDFISNMKKDNLTGFFDAIILNLPGKAHQFIEPCHSLLRQGGTLYWYTIAPDFIRAKSRKDLDILSIIELLKSMNFAKPPDGYSNEDICLDGLKICMDLPLKIKTVTRVKPYSPYKYMYCFDLIKSR
ncbi:MAG: class I SAM-dependent methyltransferase [Promethearchaeota archaeon]